MAEKEKYLNSINAHLKSAYLLSDAKAAEVLPGFLETLSEHIDRLEQSVQVEGPAEYGKVGHTVKGALLNLGLNDLAEIAHRIEEQGKNGMNAEAAKSLVRQLKEELGCLWGT